VDNVVEGAVIIRESGFTGKLIDANDEINEFNKASLKWSEENQRENYCLSRRMRCDFDDSVAFS